MNEKKSVLELRELREMREKYLERVRLECKKSRQKKIDAGLVNISVWIPTADKEKLKQLCRQVCEQHLKNKSGQL